MEQLLTTKLYIPQASADLVPRSRLYKRMDEGLTRKLTLVSAPAGFGKTTLVTSWLSKSGLQAAWLALDHGDNDSIRFWTYLIAAVQTVHQEVGGEARQIVSAPQLRNIEPAAISLINDISQLTHDLIMVLDDYHVIEAEPVHTGLNYFLEHQPTNLHLVIITRADPAISLARLRAHSQLVEIRAEDLQFSLEEARILLNERMNLDLKPEQIEALNTHTESWVVGLQLAALSLKGQSSYDTFIKKFTGEHRFILDYLIEEVLTRLPEDQREFMLRTSILERFCSKLCTAVTGDPSSGQMLDQIRKSNLFLIPLDTEGHWFRYHHLFAEVLYALLEQDHPDEIGALHLKAAEWFDSEGHAEEAMNHTLSSGDIFQAKKMFLKHWLPVLHQGEVATVLRWLDEIPEEVKRDDPNISLAMCWVLFLSWRFSKIGYHLEQASNAYERLVSEKSLTGVQQGQIAAQLALMRSVLARDQGNHTRSVACVEEAVRLMPQGQSEGVGTTWNMLAAARAGAGDFEGAIEAYERGIALSQAEGNLVGAYGCTYGQVMYMLIQGRLTRAGEVCRFSIDRAMNEGHENFPATGWLHIAMARIKLEQNLVDEAAAHLITGMRIARPGGFSEAVRSGRYLRAQLAAARGDLGTAMDTVLDTARIVNAMDEPYQIGELNSQWASLCLIAGDLDAARQKLQVLDQKCTATKHANLLIWHGWLFPRLLIDERRYEEALAALDESLGRARAGHSNGVLIRLLALQALALDALGNRKPARSALREALALGASDGYIWLWLHAGPGLVPLLCDLKTDEDTPHTAHPYLDSLLEACQSVVEELAPPQSKEMLDQLTLRELEILRLICQGYSNPEIAGELVVTTNTIKKHTSNIYGKLGVRSRTQAIARAHDLNLL